MNNRELIDFRTRLGKTQKQISELLGVSLRAVHSFEQGWRKIPTHVERQALFVLAMTTARRRSVRPCWEVQRCPPEKREHCPAWEYQCGHLCCIINGTICQGEPHRSWEEKIRFCRECAVFSRFTSLQGSKYRAPARDAEHAGRSVRGRDTSKAKKARTTRAPLTGKE
jgi:hypothetical protein